jgi:two-component system, response regulator FlrC
MRAEVAHSDQFPALMIGQTLAHVERGLILETLRHVLGNRTHAANILGISIRTLRNKLNEYANAGAEVPPPRNWSVASHQDN